MVLLLAMVPISNCRVRKYLSWCSPRFVQDESRIRLDRTFRPVLFLLRSLQLSGQRDPERLRHLQGLVLLLQAQKPAIRARIIAILKHVE